MSFAAPFWLLVGAAAALVVLLHTLRRQRVDVPSLILWRQLTAAGRSRHTVRPPKWSLLLLLQILIVLALAAALAQPAFGPGPSRPVHQVFVLDMSGSMRATDVSPSRFDAALTQMQAALSSAAEGSRTSIVLAGATPRILYARQSDGEALSRAIANLAASDGATDWEAVARKLDSVLRADEESRVVLFSDTDASAALTTAHPDVTADVHLFGEATAANAAIAAALNPTPETEGTSTLSGKVTLAGGGPAPEVVVRFRPAGGTEFLEWTRFTPDAEESNEDGVAVLPFEEELELPAAGELLLSLPTDLSPGDNDLPLVLNDPARRLQVLYVGPGNPILDLAILARGDADLFSAATPPADYSGYDLVVADNVVLAEKPPTNVLWLGTARLESEIAPEALATTLPTSWNAQHGSSEGVRWSAASAPAFAFPTMPGATVLAGAGETALVQARTTPTGREVRLGLELDEAGWGGTPEFAVFLANIFDWLAPAETGRPQACVAGQPCAFPAKSLSLPVTDDAGTVVAAPPADAPWVSDDANLFVPQRTGFYRIGDTVIAVRAPGTETNIRATPGTTAAAVEPPAAPWQASWWLILLAAALLVAEALVAGRGQEKFLTRDGLASGAPGGRMRRWVLGLRGVTVALVLAALAGLPLPSPRQQQDAVLVIDPAFVGDPRRSELVASATGHRCTGLMDPSLGLVALTAAPSVASDVPCLGNNMDAPAAGTTSAGADIAAAVELAAAMVRPDARGRVILASDGNMTGAVQPELIRNLAERNVSVDVVPLNDWPAGDDFVGSIELAAQPFEGDRLPLSAVLYSSAGGPTQVTLTADGELVNERDITLVPGVNRIDAEMPEAASGNHLYEVSIVAGSDAQVLNNRGAIAADVLPRPLVAIVTPQEEWGTYFADALALQGIETEVLRPQRAPFRLDGWLKYSAVALLNAPAIDLDTRQQEQLEEFVRIHGRGLLILGGENTFGPGGYFQTPLEAVSPLSSRVPKDAPVVAMAFVLDRSGSMQAQVEGVSRLDIAKEAALSAVNLLNEQSQVTIVVFDSVANVIVPMQAVGDGSVIAEALAPLQPGGGTSIYPGLDEALNQLAAIDSPIKHIVIMSDGLTQPGDFPTLIARAAEMNATVSTVAIGNGADVGKLEELARAGGGAFHVTRDFRALPSILSQEAMMMSGESMEVGVRPVAWVDRDDAFLVALPDPMPAIESYVLTTAKPDASLHLATQDDDGETVPIMASWQYGNGSVLALATHGAGPGSVRWLQLPQYPMLWSQVIRHFLPTTTGPGMTLSFAREGDQVRLIADILDKGGQPLAGLKPTADLSLDGAAYGRPLVLEEEAPGRYTASFGATAAGTYAAAVASDELTGTGHVAIPYPARLDFSRADPAQLEALATATGGRVLTGAEPLATNQPLIDFEPVWRPWVLMAVATLLLDLAMRYVPGLFPFLADRARQRAPRQMVPA